MNYGWVAVEAVTAGIAAHWSAADLVLIGRDSLPEIVELADTATGMRVVEHAYQRGVPGRKGIAY